MRVTRRGGLEWGLGALAAAGLSATHPVLGAETEAPRFAIDERLYPPAVVRRSWPLAWPGALGILALLVILAMAVNPPGVTP